MDSSLSVRSSRSGRGRGRGRNMLESMPTNGTNETSIFAPITTVNGGLIDLNDNEQSAKPPDKSDWNVGGAPFASPLPKELVPPLSDAEDSVCADIDRWASSSMDSLSQQGATNSEEKLRELEEEQQRLSESVLTLSTHFAQIQLRIQQINSAPSDQRDGMLKELQEFASRGCIDIGSARREVVDELLGSTDRQTTLEAVNPGGDICGAPPTAAAPHPDTPQPLTRNSVTSKVAPIDPKRNQKVVELIHHLRSQLEDLESLAYQNGHKELPLSQLKQRQKLVFDKLQEKIRLKIELEQLSEQEFQKGVDDGLEQVLNPIREKDQLVDQLQQQIIDLERFVAFLQRECAVASAAAAAAGVDVGCVESDAWMRQLRAQLSVASSTASAAVDGDGPPKGGSLTMSPPLSASGTPLHKRSLNVDPRLLEVQSLQSTSATANGGTTESGALLWRLFGCGASGSRRRFERNQLKRTPLGNHYGDQRAQLELAVDKVVAVMKKYQILSVDRSERETLPVEQLNEAIFECSEEAIVAVTRKEFCPALRALLEHGMRDTVAPCRMDTSSSFLLGAIGCASRRGAAASSHAANIKQTLKRMDGQRLEHVWDVILFYYECARALEMRDEALGRLNDAFRLDAADGRAAATSKQVLLATVENVRSTHSRLNRSADTQWKAFVSAALNHNRLPAWIRIVFRSNFVVAKCYESWSYVARTGCEEVRPLLERLHEYNFDLPVDLAVRPFEHIKEAF